MKRRKISKGEEGLSEILRQGRGQRGRKGSRIIQSKKERELEKLRKNESEE
jgi:hypothetical protein